MKLTDRFVIDIPCSDHQPIPKPIGIGVVGSSAPSRYFRERIVLHSELRIVEASDQSSFAPISDQGNSVPPQSGFATDHQFWKQLLTNELVHFIYFQGGVPFEWICKTLESGKSIVLEGPWHLSANELRCIAETSRICGNWAVPFTTHRWDDDFSQTLAAVEMGRIGRISRIRFFSYEKHMSNEHFQTGIAREIGWHLVDQLLELLRSNVSHALTNVSEIQSKWELFQHTNRNHSGDGNVPPSELHKVEGFIASFILPRMLSAEIEVQTNSRLGLRSGWMIEGTEGAIRNGRIYTSAPDGEIIDEPLPTSSEARSDFFRHLVQCAYDSPSQLPSCDEAADVADLMAGLG